MSKYRTAGPFMSHYSHFPHLLLLCPFPSTSQELETLAAKLEAEKKAIEDAAKSLREEKDTVQQCVKALSQLKPGSQYDAGSNITYITE